MKIEKRKGYNEFKERAEFYERSYKGGDEYREGDYLNRRDLESDEKYKRRKAIATYTNYAAPIQDTYIDYLMGGAIARNFGRLANTPSFESLLQDADGMGRSYYGFWKIAATVSGVQGFCAVVVDKPASNAQTRAQELAQGIRPYFALYEGYDVVNWQFTREGWKKSLDWVILEEDSGFENVEQYRIWYRNRWEVWHQPKGGEADLVDEGEHPLGVVPVVFVSNKDNGEDVTGVSDLKDIAEICRKIYNIDADIEEVRGMTAFPFLEVPERKDDEGNVIVVGSGNALTFDPDNPQARAAYVEPSHSSIKVMLEERQKAIEDLRWQSRLAFDVTGESRQVPSGYALEVLNEKLNSLLRSKAATMEHAEEAALRLFALWEGVEFDGSIDYPNQFGLRDTAEDIDIAQKALVAVPSQTFKKELGKLIALKVLGDDDPEVMDKIEQELSTPSVSSLVDNAGA